MDNDIRNTKRTSLHHRPTEERKGTGGGLNDGRKHILTFHDTGSSYRNCRIHLSDGTYRQKDYEGGTKMIKQLHKGEVAQTLLERINELTEVCDDVETALVIKHLSEARQIILNS
ncbi:hypothetical protein [Bacillus mycoides]|uniref:hypothetical protein n=1 Tax=Bacillus mycoides TaxID=1405 RepID=UPI00187A3F7C|nr:hypothetical protein [Bacillus mycoides]